MEMIISYQRSKASSMNEKVAGVAGKDLDGYTNAET